MSLRRLPHSRSATLRRRGRLIGVAALVAAPLAAIAAPPAAATHGPAAWTIDTAAGNGSLTEGGDGGSATAAGLGDVQDVATDSAGNLYIAGGNRVRKVDTTGTITTVAGTGSSGPVVSGVPATSAAVAPNGLAVDRAGNLYIADSAQVVRKVNTAGIITTVAGTPYVAGSNGDGGPATAATLNQPKGLDVDSSGNLYIADRASHRVRKVNAAGTIVTVAGTGTAGFGGDGGAGTSAQLNYPNDVVVDVAGNLYIADTNNFRVRKLGAAGVISTFAGSGAEGYEGDGGPATSALLRGVRSVEVQGANVLIADGLFGFDSGNHVIRRVDAAGTIDTVAGRYGNRGFAGDGEAATEAMFFAPVGLALDGVGHLYVADQLNRRVRVVEASYLWAATSPRLPNAGQVFDYVLTVSGLPATASGVTLTASLAPEVAFSAVTSSQGSCSGGSTVTCALGSVGVGTTANVRITVDALAPGTVPLSVTSSADDPASLPGLRSLTRSTKVSAAGCGRTVTASLVLTADIGPCAGNGLVVRAASVDVDLNGHTITGWDGPGEGRSAGVRLADVSRASVHGGTVTGFDAGVVVNGGRANTVRNLEVVGNVGPDNAWDAELGDGIVVFASSANKIVDNHLAGNGVWDGIGIFSPGSGNNTIQGNRVEGTVGPSPSGQQVDIEGHGIIINAADLAAKTVAGNVISDNTIRNNGGAGISSVNNTRGTIARNVVEGNGFGDGRAGHSGNGIGVSVGARVKSQNTSLTIEANQVHGNAGSGIELHQVGSNKVLDNNAADNAVLSTASNRYWDLRDFSSTCQGNNWLGNIWGSGGYSPACTTTGGTGPAAAATSTQTSAAEAASPAEASGGRDVPTRRPPQ